jgi:hypothetical protein
VKLLVDMNLLPHWVDSRHGVVLRKIGFKSAPGYVLRHVTGKRLLSIAKDPPARAGRLPPQERDGGLLEAVSLKVIPTVAVSLSLP